MTFRRVVELLGSLRLTVALLAASVPLIFFATLDQVELGLPATMAKYFHSVIAPWQYPENWPGGAWLKIIALPVPGGLLLGPLFFLNLLAAPFRHFRRSWKAGGLMLIHGGLLALLVGQTATDLFQRDGYVWFEIGQSRQYVTSFVRDEFFLTDTSAPDLDRVIAVDFDHLIENATSGFALPGTPFRLVPRTLVRHAGLQGSAHGTPTVPIASRGLGAEQGLQILPAPVPTGLDERATPAAVVELLAGTESLGTWLVSSLLDDRYPPQEVTFNGRTYHLGLRPSQTPLPFSLELLDFKHDKYPGTEIPRHFSSRVRLVDRAHGEDREVDISMNRPLRFGGYSFYQSAFGTDTTGRPDRASRLHAVRNPSRLVPYVACSLITAGLLWHLGLALLRRRSANAPASGPTPS